MRALHNVSGRHVYEMWTIVRKHHRRSIRTGVSNQFHIPNNFVALNGFCPFNSPNSTQSILLNPDIALRFVAGYLENASAFRLRYEFFRLSVYFKDKFH
jgi:hypothetical protein